MTNKRTQGDNKHLHAAVMSPAANIKGARDNPAAPVGTGRGALGTAPHPSSLAPIL